MRINRYVRIIKRIFLDKNYRFFIIANFGWYDKLDDIRFLKRKFKAIMGRDLNLDTPETFNEKLQWLKMHDRKQKYTVMVDKYLVRQYIAEQLGEKYLIPLLGVWEGPDEIDFDALPNQFVLKCTHNSGLGMCICKDKSVLDVQAVKRELEKGLKQNYYLTGREWPYKDIPRRIIAEEYLQDQLSNEGLADYKFFCFNGNVDCVMVCIGRQTGNTKFYFFNKDWELLRINKSGKEAPAGFSLKRPDEIDKMFAIAGKLSMGIPFIRVDLYECNHKIYFGELTLYPQSGFDLNLLPETDLYFGGLIHID
jgi:hypothetical protein